MGEQLELQNQHSAQAPLQDEWRANFLQRILIGAALISIFALYTAVSSTSNRLIQGVYIGVYLVLLALIFLRIQYQFKAGFFVILTLILGLSSLAETGIRGDGIFFLLAFVVFSALLISPRASLIALIISEVVIVMFGVLVLSNRFTLSDPTAVGTGSLFDWISAAVSQLLISWVAMAGLRMLTEGYNQARERVDSMVETLRDYQSNLEDRVAERTAALAQKTRQLNASSSVARQTADIQDLRALLDRSTQLISNHFDFYHVGIYLLNQ